MQSSANGLWFGYSAAKRTEPCIVPTFLCMSKNMLQNEWWIGIQLNAAKRDLLRQKRMYRGEMQVTMKDPFHDQQKSDKGNIRRYLQNLQTN